MPKVFTFKDDSVNDHKKYLDTIRAGLKELGTLNPEVTDEILDKLWYVYSETYEAHYLIPDNEFINEFAEWISKLELNDAWKMDHYGNIEEDE